MRAMPENCVDSIVTDPPYELGFMGKSWDSTGIAYNIEVWREALRVLKPGGHLLAFSGSRTYHRMTCAIEDAGFEIRDQIMWVYGSGFPKSKNMDGDWQGFGTALKPAHEPICVARKPLIGTVAENVQEHGTGALNIDGCRIGTEEILRSGSGGIPCRHDPAVPRQSSDAAEQSPLGRWPANLIHDGSEEVLAAFPDAGGQQGNLVNHGNCRQSPNGIFGGKSAARFFYCAKASKQDRGEGCEQIAPRQYSHDGRVTSIDNAYQRNSNSNSNHHPTVKPTELLRYLWRLVTPPGGTGLDLFMGSGSGGKAAILEGFGYIGIELDEDKDGNSLGYFPVAIARITHAVKKIEQSQAQQRLFA